MQKSDFGGSITLLEPLFWNGQPIAPVDVGAVSDLAFGKVGKVIKLRPKTYVNGLIGESGTRSLKKFINANSTLLPVGMDLKGEFKNWLNSIYDDSELYIEQRIKLSNYVTKEMDKILSVLSDEEIKNLTCVE